MNQRYHDRMMRPAAAEPAMLIPCPHCGAIAAVADSSCVAGVRRAEASGSVRIKAGRAVVTCGRCLRDFDPHEKGG